MIQKLRAFLLILLTRCLIYQRIMVKRIFFYRLNMTLVEGRDKKPLSVAVEELNQGKIKILGSE